MYKIEQVYYNKIGWIFVSSQERLLNDTFFVYVHLVSMPEYMGSGLEGIELTMKKSPLHTFLGDTSFCRVFVPHSFLKNF